MKTSTKKESEIKLLFSAQLKVSKEAKILYRKLDQLNPKQDQAEPK